MKILTGSFACVIFVIVIVVWQNRDATVYAPGFTEAKFRRIRVGMPKKEVIQILGDPVSIDRASGYIYWDYPNNCREHKHSTPDVATTFQSDVTFHADLDGKIKAVYGDCAPLDQTQHGMIGHSLEEVRKRLGEPKGIYAVPDRDYYWYSKIKSIKGQYIRGIIIYDTGIVGSVDAARIGHYIEINGVRPSPSGWLEWLEWNL